MSKGTPHRAVRVPDDVWQAALVATAANGTTVTAVIVAALTRYGTCGQPCEVCGAPCDRSADHPGPNHLCNAHAPH